MSGLTAAWGWLLARGPEVARAAGEHLGLALAAVAIAAAIGIPLGVVLTRRPTAARLVIGAANVAQTIPSLALFGFLIPVSLSVGGVRLLGGIGAGTAIAALAIYAILPILRGAYTGVTGIDPAVREAGKAMGMTDRQLRWRVELPLAMGAIFAGLRVATVLTVGMATIAAAIDAGGLGKFIFRGLRMNDHAQIMMGAVPAALIALVADQAFGWLEARLKRRPAARRRQNRLVLPVAAAIAATAVAVGFGMRPAPADTRLVVGAKDFTEQLILGEIVAQHLEARTGQQVVRRFDLSGNMAHQAMRSGEIDVYVEYTGTALTAILQEEAKVARAPAAVFDHVRRRYAERLDMEWMPPLGFNNGFAILVRAELAAARGLETISQAAPHARKWRAGFGPDFMVRQDGYRGFTRAYGLRFAKPPREMDPSLLLLALKTRQIDLAAGNATDGQIDRYGLVALEDDRRFFPPYDAAPVVRNQVLAAHPAVREALTELGGRISIAAMRRMNSEVEVGGKRPRDVARRFLKAGLVPAAP